MLKKVREVMTKDVITITPETDVIYAFEKLMKYKISSLPVVEDDKLVGIISATDLGHNLILDKYELGTQVESIMVKEVFTVSPENTIGEAINIMKNSVSDQNILNQLSVIEDDILIGIISDGDIIQHIF